MALFGKFLDEFLRYSDIYVENVPLDTQICLHNDKVLDV